MHLSTRIYDTTTSFNPHKILKSWILAVHVPRYCPPSLHIRKRKKQSHYQTTVGSRAAIGLSAEDVFMFVIATDAAQLEYLIIL